MDTRGRVLFGKPKSGWTSAVRLSVGLLTLCAFVPAFGENRNQAQQADEFVNARLAIWKQCLGFDDWQISVVMTRRSDLKPRTRGQIKWDRATKSAVIAVLDAADYELPMPEMLADMEFTIVHELVHLELSSLPRSEASRSNEEHAVNRLAEALMRLNRQK